MQPGTDSFQPIYREFPAGAFLSPAVECFWTSTSPAGPRAPTLHRVLPDGCMDLLFDFTTTANRRASVIGAMTQALTLTTAGRVDLLGIRFRPGGLSAFLAVDAAELTDEQVDLANFWGRFAAETWRQLGDATPADRHGLLHKLLIARANGRVQTDPFIQHCVNKIETTRGGLCIRDLEKTTGLSTRQLERKFARYVGISPKTFARVVRFKGLVAAVACPGPSDWAGLACDFGFADQPHLAREFKNLSGLTPSEYLDESGGMSRDVGFLQDVPAAPGCYGDCQVSRCC